MHDSHEFCAYCNKGTWIKIKDYKRETVGGLRIETSTKEGNCKACGRAMCIVEIKATEEDGK